MGQALYRKYRSKSLSEIVGQEHITQTLANALKKGNVSHAYLFTGPRGVGKTSIARILAHEVNGLPYGAETQHLDIIEIDAASNRRIEEIRDLRDKVHIAPTSAKYKVYIIDEVHMLTKEAFNALLKTLEEPPEHVIFILATTEIHKVPETIISRTQRFTFKPIHPEDVVSHLAAIAKEEGITVSPAALELIAQHGEGSFRDSISLLDQVSAHHQKVEVADVERLLGIAPAAAIEKLLQLVADGNDAKAIHAYLTELREQGLAAAQIAKQLQKLLKQQLVSGGLNLPSAQATLLMKQLLAIPAAVDADDLLLITLLETASQVEPTMATPREETPLHQPVLEEVKVESKAIAPAATFDEAWNRSLQTIKQSYNTLYGILRMAEPELKETTLTLKFAFPFHQKRINEAKNRQIIADVVAKESGQALDIVCIVDKSAVAKPVATEAAEVSTTTQPDKTLQTINDIFGGAEVLES